MEEAKGYQDCEQFLDTKQTKIKSLDSICDGNEKCSHMEFVEEEACGFGVRKYLAGKWVGTKLLQSDGDTDKMYSAAFWRLYKYIGGANDQRSKIPMTLPVITNTYLDEDFTEKETTMHLRLPATFQEHPPKPTDPSVYIQDIPDDSILYFRALGKEAKDKDVRKQEFENLAAALNNAGKKFWPYLAVAGGYTMPGWGAQRVEVMFGAVEDEAESVGYAPSERHDWLSRSHSLV